VSTPPPLSEKSAIFDVTESRLLMSECITLFVVGLRLDSLGELAALSQTPQLHLTAPLLREGG